MKTLTHDQLCTIATFIAVEAPIINVHVHTFTGDATLMAAAPYRVIAVLAPSGAVIYEDQTTT